MTVVLDLWTVRLTAVPARSGGWHAIPRACPADDLDFHKSLGTGAGKRFTARDADLRQWALLTCWSGPDDDPHRHLWEVERPGRGTHALHDGRDRQPADGPAGAVHARPCIRPARRSIAAITRAQVRTGCGGPSNAPCHRSPALHATDGLLCRIGIGEAPIGLQGTFSVWRDAAALRACSPTKAPEHRRGDRTDQGTGWYSEELFARFAVPRCQRGLAVVTDISPRQRAAAVPWVFAWCSHSGPDHVDPGAGRRS